MVSLGRIGMIDRARYRVRHEGLAIWLGAVMKLFHTAMNPRLANPSAAAILMLQRRFHQLLARDLDNVERGVYPRELLFELRFVDFLRHAPEAWADAPRYLWRFYRRRFDDLPADVDLSAYPAYYRRNFHWQTDGWLSDRSARLYDLNVETLFGGTGDVMRRMVIPPLKDGLAGVAGPRVLDVACGTGRFLGTLRRALPDARLAGIDLSPFYVERARTQLAGGVELVTGNAEQLPWPDASFDAVTSVFLFHELPSDARRNVMREVLRVLKPGGRFVVCDSAQLTDSPELAVFLDAFARLYHEPYYKGYQRDELGAALAEVGFDVLHRATPFVSKIVVAAAPARAPKGL